MDQKLVERLGSGGGVADTFVCGSASFVEAATTLLLAVGQPAEMIHTERFGATGVSALDAISRRIRGAIESPKRRRGVPARGAHYASRRPFLRADAARR